MSQERHLIQLAKAEEAIENGTAKVGESRFRQHYHFMPPVGWMNDPNGFIHYKGQYHLFYQFNPYGPQWGAMHWGHAVSDDLVYWRHLPVALAPSESYDDHPGGGCFSGSAIVDEGELKLIYTGTAQVEGEMRQTQCLAISPDGIHFEKYDGNPVISTVPPEGTHDFRDPKAWWHKGKWYLVLGTCRDNRGKVLLYESDDLISWKYRNVVAESRGEFGTMWECPDLFGIGEKHVLLFSPIGSGDRKTVYLVGELDEQTGKLSVASQGEFDWGFDAYAPQTLLNDEGRRIAIAWANNWNWMPWFQNFGPTGQDGWCGAMTLPRDVAFDSTDGLLRFMPVTELKKLRGDSWEMEGVAQDGSAVALHAGDGVHAEILIDINLSQSDCKAFRFVLREGRGFETILEVDLAACELMLDRNRADGCSQGCCRATLRDAGKERMQIRVFMDTSSIEVYADGGKTVMSCNIFPDDDCNHASLVAEGGSLAFRMRTWGMGSIWS